MSQKSSFYPQVDSTNPDANSSSSSFSMYPNTAYSSQQVLVTVPNVILHLIEKDSSVHLASGDLTIVSLKEDNNVVAVLARISDQIQWPLAKDVSTVKLDDSHYFFTLQIPQSKTESGTEVLNYGMTVATKGEESVLILKELDKILEKYSFFSVEKVKGVKGWEVLEEKREDVEESSAAAYWTTLAPNVEDYSGRFARWIAAGSGQVVRGILWCGDVTVERLKWGNDFMKKRLQPGSKSQISPHALESIKRVKKLTKMSEKVAIGILTGVVKVSGFFTSSVVNSKPGKKFFSFLPGEVLLASLDGFNKVCDAVEVAGRNVLSTSSVVTTGLVSHK
uniref:Protein EARLY-RESPONSIVE TO DEHYDRATION 7, chloroplastic-like n=2 Tax=Cicer arietinum TaxID=3827 RepID=A0A3Q7YD71_CICAR|nr:protein EARLY-RESPONSIVE TO DEHYDRATION 7, chloroplastic-like [Cicer arietinum]